MIKTNQICSSFLNSTVNGPADLPARVQALDVTESWLCRSPAGSGKTEVLTQRYLALMSVVNEPEEILAITFTNKAGAEMRARVINALIKADTQPMPETSHEQLTWQLARNALDHASEKGWDILNNPSRLRIKTIDAFYGSLAKRAPLSGMIGGGLQITDDYQSCYIKAARELLGELESSADWIPALESILMHVDNRFDRAEELLISLLVKREHWLPIVLSARGTDDLRLRLEHTLQLVVQELIGEIRSDLNTYAGAIVEMATFAASNLDPVESRDLQPLNAVAASCTLPGDETVDLPVWQALGTLFLTKEGKLRKSPTAAIGFPAPSNAKDKGQKALLTEKKDAFKALLDDLSADSRAESALTRVLTLPPTAYQDGEWAVLESLLTLLPILAAKLLMVFQREGVVDHAEIATAALRVLGDVDEPTDLALVLDSQLQHLLIDEFQDTSVIQLNGLRLITAGWQPGDGRTLFLVGDAQQSIYGFRGSNVGLFMDVANNGVGSLQVNTIDLTVNFRSQSNIVEWVNAMFGTVFPKEQNSNLGSVPYSPSVPHLPAIQGVQAVRTVGFAGDLSQTRMAEGKWLATEIQSLRDADENCTIAVLVRNRSHLESTVASIQELNIPYQAIEIDPLKDRLVVRDLSSLTRALCNLGDRTAWLALLRSPLCGLTLGELEAVAVCNSKSLIWENLTKPEVVSNLTDEAQKRIARVVEVMRNSMRWKERKSLATVVEGAWLALFGPSTIEQDSDLDNVKSFFEVLKRFSYTTFDVKAFDSSLEGLYARPEVRDTNPVQVMTLHKSKGLQFDHVFIPGCERQSRPDDTRLLAWDRYTTASGHELPLLSPSPEIGGSGNALYEFIGKQESMRTDYERDRILYVGCTRAKKHLYLTCSLSLDAAGAPVAPPKRSFMGSLWNAVNDQVEVVMVESIQDSELSHHTQAPVPKKLASPICVPALPEGNLLAKYRGRMATNNKSLPDLAWKVDYSSQFGELLHRILRRVCLDGVSAWGPDSINARKDVWKHQLLQSGVPGYLCPTMVNKLSDMVKATLQNPKAQWMLDHSHAQSACEMPVSTMVKGDLKQFVLDRTFVDGGVRWVIDYKSSSPLDGETLAAFEARLAQDHREQLTQYALLLADLGNEPVRAGIFATSTGSFIEVNVAEARAAA